MQKFNHSVILDKQLCKGCTNCIKRCPTEAIRITKGKARIIDKRCIDCGECIRQCPYHAKKAKADSLDLLSNYEYKIALPAPALYGQFGNITDMNYVLSGLLEIGFDDVYEVSTGAEQVTRYTKELLAAGKLKKPVISSACPAVAKLISSRFPNLRKNVLPVISPMQTAARMAKEEAIIKKGYAEEQIGIFFISPCSAKITEVHQPLGIKQSWVDGAFSMAEIYPLLLEAIGKIETPKKLARSGIKGVKWASSGGEASGVLPERYLAADGMENIMAVLEELEDSRLEELDFIELNACPGGCVGGVLTVQNPYIAKARIQDMQRDEENLFRDGITTIDNQYLDWQTELENTRAMQLSSDRKLALKLMMKMEEIHKLLPDLDCGSCGAPRCRALAEDIALGKASLDDCIFILRDRAAQAKQEEQKGEKNDNN